MPFCSNCGKEMEPGIKFCSNCGAPLGTGGGRPPKAPGKRRPVAIFLLVLLSFVLGAIYVFEGVLGLTALAVTPLVVVLGVLLVAAGAGALLTGYGLLKRSGWLRRSAVATAAGLFAVGFLLLLGGGGLAVIGGVGVVAGIALLLVKRLPGTDEYLTA